MSRKCDRQPQQDEQDEQDSSITSILFVLLLLALVVLSGHSFQVVRREGAEALVPLAVAISVSPWWASAGLDLASEGWQSGLLRRF
jgi:hypothetical protein